METHERGLNEGLHAGAQPPSPRGTGLVFAAMAGIGAWMLRDTAAVWPLSGLCAAFASLAVLRPALLEPLNRVWFRLSLVLGRIMTPLVMAVLFYGLITPIALLLRVKGDDPLRLKRTGTERTWWRERDEEDGDMSRQF